MALQRRSPSIRVALLSDDNKLIHHIRLLLQESFGLQLAGIVPYSRQYIKDLSGIAADVVLISDEGRANVFELSKEINLKLTRVATVILSRRHDVDLLKKALAAGARDVIPLPSAVEELTEFALERSISQAHAWLRSPRQGAMRDEETDRQGAGFTVAVYSPKGGTGKTVVATNLGVLLAQKKTEVRTVLVDFDLQFGDASLMLDLRESRAVSDLLQVINDLTEAALANVLCGHRSGLRVLPSPGGPEAASQFGAEACDKILRALKGYFGYLIIDTASALNEATAVALEAADQILLVCTPDIPAIRKTHLALEFLRSSGIPFSNIGMVVNRVSKQAEIQPSHIAKIFGLPIVATIPANFPAIQPYINAGGSMVDGRLVPQVSEQLNKLLDRLTSARIPATSAPR